MNKTVIKNKLKQESFVPSKKMGQNFLLSNEIKNKIVNVANISKDDLILEIGPGWGAITELLVQKTDTLVAIELDKRLYAHLKTYIKAPNFHIINNDVLCVDLDKLILDYTNTKKNQKIKVVANLPYAISSKIVLKIIQSKLINDAYIMVQKEMAERIGAKVNTRGYNAFTVLVQLFCKTKILFQVNAKEFHPQPKVQSAVIHLENLHNKVDFDIEQVSKFLRICFLNKRKKLKNNLSNIYDIKLVNEMFIDYNLDMNLRAENIEPKMFLELFNYLNKSNNE
ncbi:16S rRNA (adenine(1518)-N(6)/adenine(1519)-N(6))-dimethyltransferase RsmA [Ureaplasma urealyticum]|uniref:Ribosomal RNA small subunit methyltransferase A n=3 Tax=Ureaplasma urealyticum TaxID=2130 RepID=RSMA_UREU1|nr:16S rRNA (adenine(1518)-N(6)/adenine(1519)-N(6))-dimethyltransferase RsmA [Ureaplasma urealyticum]B5ZCB6.1 RecName: Full=Ribosomal RNA small subunit methyltransferase A; AltName: Full=16S rRNA (adenine(1518)-N(6)/adenine(1519)-N(6))-dimethyltransferase; AltName: Full=16S rRNA dimethyladenosine transferase; AltName: Full=16S rRNA dimethylase; AltName: Full=S-adenosylmethionine-6-N', N'-adenosyl(rRNA) dimethyltransferase [Ureaplasma urealyticum serovar 10 str. ATCC 33699]EDX54171.1 dimethyladeno